MRNRGTIGGSLAQADPHGDLPAVALALGAEIVVQSPAGTRTIAADDFFVDYFTTALDEGELITEIRIPGGQSQGAYAKFNRRTAGLGARWARRSRRAPAAGASRCAAPAPTAVRAAARRGGARRGRIARPTPHAHAAEGISPEADLGGSTEYKRHLATVMVRRALEAAGA